ncbi:MAG: hypothetical protein LBV13_05220 [Methanomassiliicoccaceae archaeon]|jgi:hypothetical protein|nr:hypothetical protein [Methanomassiliicoccaceae archaeon]
MGFLSKITKTVTKSIINKSNKEDKHANQSTNRPNAGDGLMPLEPAGSSTKPKKSRNLALPINHGNSWTAEEERKIKSRYDGGASIADIANAHGRTSNAIADRLIKLGYKGIQSPR